MAKRKQNETQRPRSKEDKDLQALYAKMRRKFSAADLQKYTEIEEGIPAEQVLAEMEGIYRNFTSKKA